MLGFSSETLAVEGAGNQLKKAAGVSGCDSKEDRVGKEEVMEGATGQRSGRSPWTGDM